MNTHRLLLFILAGLLSRASAAEIHVSPSGNDANAGSSAAPLATFAAAQSKARTLAGTQPVDVIFHAGTYYLADTIRFTAADSGTAANPVTYRAAAGESVALSGGNRLQGLTWTTHSGSIKKATVPAGMLIDQLFAGNVKQNLARYPDYNASVRIFNGYAANCISTARAANWANPAGGFFHAMHSGQWGGFHYRITGKNASNVVSYTGGQQNNRASSPHGTYRFVENIFEELTAAGEWFHNTSTNTLYFYPPAGVDPSTAVLETAGRLKQLVQFDGTEAAPVKYVNLSGFIFRHAARTFMESYEPLLRSDWKIYRGAAVLLTGTEDCAISGCEFDQLGGNAVFFSKYNRRGSVSDSYFHGIGASGVCFVGDPSAVRNPLFNYDSPANSYASIDKTNAGPKNNNYPADCLVENCLITGIGRVEKQPAGVEISMSSRITVSHCSIYDCARSGINVGDGCWGGHVIEYCDTFDTVLETSDHGSFNAWGRDRFWRLTGATNAQLKALSLLDACEVITLRNSRWQCDHGWDIDLDDGSSNYLIENNLLLNRGLKWREGFYRTGRNNVILNSSLHPHVWYPDSGDIFERNIVSDRYQPASMSGSLTTWGESLDYNLFPSEANRTAYASKGCDAHSLSGDPRFVSPATGNYQVTAQSPAVALGFVNFPMNQFGVTTRPFTVNSKSITVRTPSLVGNPVPPSVKPAAWFRWLGARVKSVVTIEEASAFGTNPVDGGVFFTEDYIGSVAAATGIFETDLIASINGNSVATVEDMIAFLSAATGNVTFGLVRDQAPFSLVVPSSLLSQAGTLALEEGTMTVPSGGLAVDSFVLLGGLATGTGSITAGNIEVRDGTVTVALVSTGAASKTGDGTAILTRLASSSGLRVNTGTLKLDPTLAPPVKNGLILRLDASAATSIVSTGGNVTRWMDADGNGSRAEQTTAAKIPTLQANALNGRPVLDFGAYSYGNGNGKSMRFKDASGTDTNLGTIRTAFWVMKGSNHLLTHTTSYNFHRGNGDGAAQPAASTASIWDTYSHANVTGGSTFLNGTGVNGLNTGLSSSAYNLVSLVTTGNVEANTLCADRASRSGGQQIAEVILYDRALGTTERQQVEAYLRYKWFGGAAPSSTALSPRAVVTAGAVLDLPTSFTHSTGVLTLEGTAQLDATGSFLNQAAIDIRSWSGTLPAGLTNEGMVVRPAQGDGIDWQPPSTITGDADISAVGTPGYAYTWGNATTVHGVPFTAVTGPASSVDTFSIGGDIDIRVVAPFTLNRYPGFGTGIAPTAELTTAARDLLLGGIYISPNSPGTPVALTLKNLTPGKNYLVQIWVDDSRASAASRTLAAIGNNSVNLAHSNSNSAGGLGQQATGTFTASASTLTFFLIGNASTQLNAIQLRQLPEPDVFAAWINSYPSLVNPADKVRDADPDHDGVPNFAEFALAGNPASGSTGGRIASKSSTIADATRLTLTLPVRGSAVFSGSPPSALADGVRYWIVGGNTPDASDAEVSEVVPALSDGMPGLEGGWSYRTFFLVAPVSAAERGFLKAIVAEP